MNRVIAAGVLVFAATMGSAPDLAGTPMSAVVVAATVHDTFDVGMLRVEHRGTPSRIPIIFIPALFCGSWQWEREVAALSDRYDVYTLTLPGFDGRRRDTGGNLMERAASDISALIRTRQLDHPILVGHSLGGTLTVLFAETHPDEARAIIAVEGGYPIAPTAAGRDQRVRASTAPYLGVESGPAFGSVLRANMLQYVITSGAAVDSVERLAARTDPAAMVDWMRAALLLDLTPGLRQLLVPLVEIVPFDRSIDSYQGFASEAAKRKRYESWVAEARHGSVVMIGHSRHFVMLDQPVAFDRVLYGAIARFATPGQPRRK